MIVYAIGVYKYNAFSILWDIVALSSTFPPLQVYISYLDALICRISVTFVDKDGEEQHIKVPIGMSMLEAAHENDIELEGKDSDTYLVQRFASLHLSNFVLLGFNESNFL